MQISTWKLILAGLAFVAGCAPDAEPMPIVDKLDASFAFSCVDYGVAGTSDDRPFSGAGSTATLERCIYHDVSHSLTVNLVGVGSLDINITGFTGVGTYDTSELETGTSLFFSSATEPQGGTWASDPVGSFPSHACTIRVTDTNLPDVTIPATSSAVGYLVFSIDCPTVGWGAVGSIECQLSPSVQTFTVAACEALTD